MRNVCIKMICLLSVIFSTVQGDAQEPLRPLAIQLSWLPHVEFVGIFLAKERGWYAQAGISLNIRERKPGLVLVNQVITDKAQIGIIDGSKIIEARARGSAIKAIAAGFQKSPLCLFSKKARGIRTPEQMIGKKIGITTPGAELMIKIVLANQGLKFEDIIPVRTGWGSLRPFLDDEVDVWPGYMNDEPLSLKAKGYDIVYMPAFNYGYNFYSGTYFTTDAMIQAHPELIEDFLKVTLRGWDEAFKNPAIAAQLVVSKYYPKGSVQQQTASLKIFRMLATLGEGKKFLGWMEDKHWSKGVDILHKFKQIEKKIPVRDLFTPEFLENIYFGKE